MEYTITAHPTIYKDVQFRSRLEARWAAFFDLLSWKWEYEPFDLEGWTPDFQLWEPCGHSECEGGHNLLAEVKPYSRVEQFKWHPIRSEKYFWNSIALGLNPTVVIWEMSHGAGGGSFDFNYSYTEEEINSAWIKAGNHTMYKRK